MNPPLSLVAGLNYSYLRDAHHVYVAKSTSTEQSAINELEAVKEAVNLSATLSEDIAKIAVKHCADRPEIGTKESPHCQLYAIEQTLEGVIAANEDCHVVIQELRKRLGLSPEELVVLWRSLLPTP